jgi:anion-transporting  ArsA/GET3 family ATPase
MNLHLVVTTDAKPELGSRIKTLFGDDGREIASNQWVVAADMTDQALSQKLGASEGQFGRIMVATFTTYYGWHDKDLWGWLSLKESR